MCHPVYKHRQFLHSGASMLLKCVFPAARGQALSLRSTVALHHFLTPLSCVRGRKRERRRRGRISPSLSLPLSLSLPSLLRKTDAKVRTFSNHLPLLLSAQPLSPLPHSLLSPLSLYSWPFLSFPIGKSTLRGGEHHRRKQSPVQE